MTYTTEQLEAMVAAANARADQARDAALVEAAGTLEVQALDTDAQAKRFRGGSDPWADRTARSRALRNSAAAILALRDKPAPAQCCMCGKTDLSTVEGDGGPECQLDDGRWTCSHACYDRATEEPAPAVTVGGGLCGCCGERPIAYPIEGECIECFSANEGVEL